MTVDFLKKIHSTVANGGKVLIPVFALGRAQELCILLESYWERMKLDVPIYFTAGLAEKATNYYSKFILTLLNASIHVIIRVYMNDVSIEKMCTLALYTAITIRPKNF